MSPTQVIGPAAVRAWLREVGPHMGLRYIFVSCDDANRTAPPLPARTRLLQQLGDAHFDLVRPLDISS